MSNPGLDQYALSMFKFEHLHDPWIDQCARYLRSLFGEAIQEAVVIDYAFGRGNWSIAFLRAGAAKVIAIDASATNVARLENYVRRQNISNIEICHGNVMEAPLEFRADILWLYGIIPCLDDPNRFMSLMTDMWAEPKKGLGLVYGYNRFSLRQIIVDLARKAMTFDTYASFEDEALVFSQSARMRVRDDLTAPRVLWQSKREMGALVTDARSSPIRFVQSFAEFQGNSNREFEPHHLIFSGEEEDASLAQDDEDFGIDESIIRSFGERVLAILPAERRRLFSIGLTNTHFGALEKGYNAALIANFSFLLYAWKISAACPIDELQHEIMRLAESSLRNEPGRAVSAPFLGSVIANHLAKHSIRI